MIFYLVDADREIMGEITVGADGEPCLDTNMDILLISEEEYNNPPTEEED